MVHIPEVSFIFLKKSIVSLLFRLNNFFWYIFKFFSFSFTLESSTWVFEKFVVIVFLVLKFSFAYSLYLYFCENFYFFTCFKSVHKYSLNYFYDSCLKSLSDDSDICAISLLMSVDWSSLFELTFFGMMSYFLLYPGYFGQYYMWFRFLFKFHYCQTRMVIWAVFTQIISTDIRWPEGELYPYCLCVMIVRLCLYTSVDAHLLKRKLSPYCHLGIVVCLCLHTKSLQIPHQPGADLLPHCNMEWKSGLCSLWLE